MLAERIASLINRYWAWMLIAWLALAIGLKLVAPSWDSIAKDGDLEYLPPSVPSLRGERLLQEAFPNEKAHSQVSIVLSRDGAPLTPDDRRFGLTLAAAIDPFGVGVGDGVAHRLELLDQREQPLEEVRLARLMALRMRLLNRLGKGPARVEPHRVITAAPLLAVLVDRGRSRVGELRSDTGLAQEPLAVAFRAAQLGEQFFEGHLPAEQRVFRQPDLPDAALRVQTQQP